MIKITIYDIVNKEDVWVFEGEEAEAEIHLRSMYMKETKGIEAGKIYEILLAISKRFGIFIAAWNKVI